MLVVGRYVQSIFLHGQKLGGGWVLAKWLEALPTNSALRQPYGTQTLEESIIKELEEATASKVTRTAKEVVMQVKPHLIYLPNHLAGCALVEPGTVFCLYEVTGATIDQDVFRSQLQINTDVTRPQAHKAL